MYHSNARFNRYGGFNKREHIVKFKIRDKTTTPSIIGITKPQPITSCSSSSSSSADQFDLIEKPVIKNPIKSPVIKSPVIKNDTIFDFPDTEETLEVKLMVASGRAIPEHHKKPKKPKKKVSPVNTPRSSSTTTTTNTTIKKSTAQKKKSMNKPVKVTPSRTVPIMQTLTNDLLQNALPLQKVPKQQIHNKLPHYASTVLPNQHPLLAQQNRLIQQQDYQYQRNQHQLNLIMQQQQLIQQQQQQQQQLLQVQQESIFDIFDFDYNPQVSIKHNSTINDSYGIGTSNPINTIQPNLNYTSNLFTSNTTSLVSLSSLVKDKKPHTPEKKRKRNLVSHLKTARGEIASAPSFDFLSDEEDPMPIRDVPLTLPRSVSPELSYNERMELELKSMTQPEPITSTESKRIPYQPQNKLNVKITFKKPQ